MNHPVTILVVDDEKINLNMTRRTLEAAGYQLICAENGTDGLRLVRQHKPELVLLDVNLPDISGLKMCQQIKADPALRSVFVVMFSSIHTDSDSQSSGLEVGADGYIARPIANRELLARVQALLRIQAAESALQASLSLWVSTFDAVSDAIFVTDADFTILKCNRATEQAFRISKQDLLGQKCYQVVHGSSAPVAQCPLRAVKESKRRQTIVLERFKHWLEVHVDPVLDPAGNFIGSVHVISNITERKQAEDALRESEEKYRRIIETTQEGIWAIDAENKTTFVNRMMAAMLGYSVDEMMGASLFAFMDEEGKVIAAQNVERRRQDIKEQHDFKFLRKDGADLWAIVETSPIFDKDRHYAGALAMITDITERKRLEAERGLLVNTITASLNEIYLFDAASLRFKFVNQGALDNLQLTLEQAQQLTPLDIKPEFDAESFQRLIAPLLTGEKLVQVFETVHRRADGTRYPVDVHLQWFEKEDIFLTVIQDITQRKQAEETLSATERRYRDLFENASLAVFQSAPDGKLIAVNPEFARMFGYPSPEDVRATVHDAATLFADPQRRAEIVRLRTENPALNKFENVYLRQDGSTFIGQLTVSTVMDADGRLQFFEGFIEDITARKRAEETLQESETRFATLFRANPAAIAITQLDNSRLIDVNESWQDLTGYAHADAIGHTPLELNLWINPEQRDHLVELVLMQGKARGEMRLRRKSGDERDLLMSVERIELAGKHYLITMAQDITERKLAQAALEKVSTELQLIFKNMINAFIIWESVFDESGKYVSFRFGQFNDAYAQIAKLKYEEVQGKNVFEVWPATEQSWVDAYGEVALTGIPSTFDMFHEPTNGWYHCNAYRPTDSPAQVCVIFEDITERKRAEDALRESEALSQAILRNSPIGISVRSRTGRLLSANDAWKKIWAIPEMALLEDSTRQRQTLNFDASDHYLAPYQDEVRHVYEQGGSLYLPELKTLHAMPGAAEWISQHFYAIKDAQGQVERVVILTEDITERKRADETLRETSERLAHIISNSPTAIYALKVEGTNIIPTWISDNIESILGFHVEDGLRPEWWPQQIHPQDRPDALAALDHLLDEFYQHEYRFFRKDGQLIWLHDEHRMLRDANHQPREIIGAWTDITMRKQAEDTLREYNTRLAVEVETRTHQLREAQEQLVRQEKLAVLGQLAGGVGHELRNPLGVINNAVYFLKLIQPDANDKVKEYLAMIQHETSNAEKIINDLLDFARIKSVAQGMVGVQTLVASVLERFSVPEGIHVTIDIPNDLPSVYADPRQVEQVLGNLVINACQAMISTGSVDSPISELTISAVQQSNEIAIAVRDTGVGISPENLRKLFEPLFTTKPKGIGLGLAISRKLAEANGGRIEVQSELGRGAAFTLILPVKP